ncbi:YeeE/YedE family protein [Nitrogeniibacter aestuarii]|uniref:YeeE/YedE family protein n=1 Tax=Nitrogeniibacter aestuarii TaxID=2815343 RepID=UPI001E34EFE3|nr:YeeE/YedE thiosulfate transporter family protein [Nitrogeniibacter aestuarii]
MVDSLFPNGIAPYLTGGILIGLGVALLYVVTGRQGGASTFFSSSWSWLLNTPFFRQPSLRGSRQWRLVYAAGFVLGGLIYLGLGLPQAPSHMPAWKLALGGVLIGYGARLGGGCTSGHGICGMASLNRGSMLIVLTFMTTAIITAWVMKALGVGA